MIYLIYLIVYITIIIMSYLRYKKINNINMVITTVWFFFSLMSSFGLYGLRVPHIEIHILVIMFIFTFNVFSMIIPYKKAIYKSHINFRMLYFLIVLSILLISPFLMGSIQYFIVTGDFSSITREIYFSGDLSNSYFYVLFFRDIPMALINALIISLNIIYFKIQKNKKFLYLSIFLVLMGTFV